MMKPDGSGERILTEGFHNEGPTWAPNGLFRDVFPQWRRRREIFMVDIFGRGEFPVPTPSYRLRPLMEPAAGLRGGAPCVRLPKKSHDDHEIAIFAAFWP